jgi:hypothetical protein
MAREIDRTFVTGLVILLFGWIACLNLYFVIFGGPVLLIGLAILWFSKRKLTTKILWTVLPLVLWYPVIMAFQFIAIKRTTPEIFFIPENFRGQITLLYNENCGQEIKKVNGQLIYNVPENGVMIIKKQRTTGLINHEYYFVSNPGNKLKKIDLLIQQDFNEDYTLKINEKEPPRDEVGVFLVGPGGGSSLKNENYVFHIMHVNSWDSLRVYNDKQHVQLVDSLLYQCRQTRK